MLISTSNGPGMFGPNRVPPFKVTKAQNLKSIYLFLFIIKMSTNFFVYKKKEKVKLEVAKIENKNKRGYMLFSLQLLEMDFLGKKW